MKEREIINMPGFRREELSKEHRKLLMELDEMRAAVTNINPEKLISKTNIEILDSILAEMAEVIRDAIVDQMERHTQIRQIVFAEEEHDDG